ncbi:fructose-6-phosphate aldolase [Pectinatus cerevisiiphilus]|uniref:TalC/MipB family fructose-6-phosphate aldolase n=1 Tax=Pectinatus cerevisiiphilus TaxID=86956 RepID=A0A4R3K2D2_9FIRM|nr:fructose-6-phosphate aldolase [Pectinatus cerevisiiphilus]TCS76435.1 TalC/MipB family fructose-6-phosphate aldolase [Pectinatus cerevisiiphilus]
MKYLVDTANIEMIEKCTDLLPIAGVTSNPSIIKKEGKIDFFAHFKKIRQIIGKDRTLHMQILAECSDGILKEAHTILDKVDKNVFIKVPTTPEGLKAMRLLKKEGVGVTATAIYTKTQGLMAMEAGADYIAPYFNRMENLDIDAADTIATFSDMIAAYGYSTQILAASFKNIAQVNTAFRCGAQTATVGPDILLAAFAVPSIKKAVDDFAADWQKVFGDVSICDL